MITVEREVFVLARRGVFLHEHDSDNAVQFSRHHRDQHAHSRRPKEHGAEMASPGKNVPTFNPSADRSDACTTKQKHSKTIYKLIVFEEYMRR